MKTTAEFEKALKALNTQQKTAVEAIEGTVMVLAGPGTGKTQVVALRIANILRKTQMGPNNILALTFTEAGVTALRERLTKVIGPAGYQVTIATFHGFAGEVIAIFPHLFVQTRSLRQIKDAERYLLIEEILNENKSFQHLRPLRKPDLYVYEISQKIKVSKQENITPERLKELILLDKSAKPEMVNRLNEFVDLYQRYNDELASRGWYDYEDTIQFVVEALQKNAEVKAYFQERYQYILVDEYQDTNNSQNALVEALADFYSDPNLFVVGDDKQAIYRFQGASVANMLHFKKRYPSMRVITLSANYRSTPEILAAADQLIGHNRTQISRLIGDGKVSLDGTKDSGRPVSLVEAPSPLAQFHFIVQEVVKAQKAGIPLSSIAVLWRRRQDVAEFGAFAQKAGLSISGQVLTELFADPAIRSLMRMLAAVEDPTNNVAVIAALQPMLADKDLITLYKINRSSRSASILIEKLLKENGALRKAAGYILEANRLSETYSIDELLEWLLSESPLITDRLKGKNVLNQAEILLAFYEQAKNFSAQPGATLGAFLKYCQKTSERNLDVPIVKLLPDEGLFVGTVHSAKGLEFNRVFIAGADEKRWSLKKKPEILKLPGEIVGIDNWQDDVVEDERRLFYVAITRAVEHLTVIYSSSGNNNETLLPCQFVSEIDSSLERQAAKTLPAEIVQSAKAVLTGSSAKQLSEQALEHARTVIANSPFSYSDMRCYLTCPRQYYLGRVLRLPQPTSESLVYGNIVHKALEQFFRGFKGFKKRPSRERLLELADEAVDQLAPTQSQERLKAHTKKVLDAYYLAKATSWKIPAGIEYSFTHHQVRYGDIWLTGKIDRLDVINGNQVRLVDYKTKSRPPSRNEIEGKTKNSDGEMKDQLVFYAMLANLDPLFPFHVSDYQISIIDDQLKFPDEVLAVSSGDIKQMEQRIAQTYTEILSTRDFLHTRVEFDKGCELCQLYD